MDPHRLTTPQKHTRGLGEELFLRREVAELLEIGKHRLNAAAGAGCGPSRQLRLGGSGKSYYWLYTLDDIAQVERWLAEHPAPRPGRPRQWSLEQTRERTNLSGLRRHYRMRVEALPDGPARERAKTRLSEVQAQWDAMTPRVE